MGNGLVVLLRPRRPSAAPYGKSHPVETDPYVYQHQALRTGLAESTHSPPSFPTMNIHTGDPPLQWKCLAYMEMLGSVGRVLGSVLLKTFDSHPTAKTLQLHGGLHDRKFYAVRSSKDGSACHLNTIKTAHIGK